MFNNEAEYNDAMASQAYYEAEQASYAAEAEAQQEAEYENYLNKLLERGENALFAAHVAEDWLMSKEFAESNLTALEYIRKLREKFQSKVVV